MSPGQWAGSGFLGPNETLQEVVARDAQFLRSVGVTHEQLAKKLEELLQAVGNEIVETGGSSVRRGHLEASFTGAYRGAQTCPFSEKATQFGIVAGNCSHNTASQEYGSVDFKVTNSDTGEEVSGPGLILHLIRDHHFFEGNVAYRVDPEKLCRVLGFIPV